MKALSYQLSAVSGLLAGIVFTTVLATPARAQYDVIIAGGRVMDPESGLDGVRWIGIRNGKIEVVSERPLTGRSTIDASGLVVAPGFIDLHAHGQDDENYRIYALDGVTTALEMEVGTSDIPGWYAAREGKALVNFGATISHVQSRMKVLGDPSTFLPSGEGGRGIATQQQIGEIQQRLREGLRQGALGIGFGLQYTPGATKWEVLEMFRVAAEARAPAFVHVRAFGTREPGSSVESFVEVIGAAAITGAPLHIVHLNSMSLSSTPQTLRIVEEARGRGLDVTTEAYPYSAGMTAIESALFDQYQNAPDSVYQQFMWVATGERLTRESFERYRKQGGMVVLFLNTPEMEALAIASPLTAIASDGMLSGGKGHPRTSGTYARVLGHYVREKQAISLMDAIRKMALLPAQRLEQWAPVFAAKGRIKPGADADLAIFDPATVIDRATYQQPALPSEGFRHVLVNGVSVVKDGALVTGVFPGRGVKH
ncbi:MAG TPA: amidohydrolase family protein [Gemmatimonadales bacterium]|nr:amidohydrolase family protein [Gemmatimonadales bacterium]